MSKTIYFACACFIYCASDFEFAASVYFLCNTISVFFVQFGETYTPKFFKDFRLYSSFGFMQFWLSLMAHACMLFPNWTENRTINIPYTNLLNWKGITNYCDLLCNYIHLVLLILIYNNFSEELSTLHTTQERCPSLYFWKWFANDVSGLLPGWFWICVPSSSTVFLRSWWNMEYVAHLWVDQNIALARLCRYRMTWQTYTYGMELFQSL